MRRAPLALAVLVAAAFIPVALPHARAAAPECRDAESCLGAALGLGQDGAELDIDQLLRKLTLFDRACNYGSGDGCLALARVAHFVPQYQTRQRELFARAVSAFERKCADGDMQDCALLLSMYRAGEGLPEKLDRVESAERYVVVQIARGCAKERTAACLLLADLFTRGEFGLQRSQDRAKELRARATTTKAK